MVHLSIVGAVGEDVDPDGTLEGDGVESVGSLDGASVVGGVGCRVGPEDASVGGLVGDDVWAEE